MQKKKRTKQILSAILAVIFAFAPIFFAGCNFDPDDSGGSSSSGGGTITTNYKISDYLDAVKVSYSVSGLSADTQNEEIQEYSDQIINLTQMLAVDTMIGLMQQYAIFNNEKKSFGVDKLKKEFDKSNIPFNENISQTSDNLFEVKDIETEIVDKYSYNRDNVKNSNNDKFTFSKAIEKWSYFDKTLTYESFDDYLQALGLTQSNSTNLYKITYAILSIVDTFDNVKETDFNAKYTEFLNKYDTKDKSSSTNWENESKTLSYNVKHSGLYANSLESKAFKQFILDRVIGENLVSEDNRLFQVYKQTSSGSSYLPTYDYTTPDANEKFRGETFYYNPDAEYVDGEVNDISLYINLNYAYNGEPNCEELSGKLKTIVSGKSDETEIINGTQVKMWQDIDSSGDIEFSDEIGNIVYAKEMNDYGGQIDVAYPKYRALVGFRNYDYTVETIVENALTDTTNKLNVDGEKIQSDTNYPVIANVFSKNYSYTAVEVKGTSNDNSTSCKLPKMAYKSVLLSMKDRTQMDVKNSLGTIYLLLESSAGVKVNVTMYARYYRKGSGFALFGSGAEMSSFYKFPNGSGEVDGPYGIDFSGSEIKEGCLFELEFEDMFKSAKFKNGDTYVSNNQTFDYTYQTEDKETKTIPIYEIKPFPKDYAPISNSAGHAGIYTGIDYKTKPVYEAQNIAGATGSLYAYSEDNLNGYDGECEFMELIFVTDNDNPFTFGFTGFVPQTELYH